MVWDVESGSFGSVVMSKERDKGDRGEEAGGRRHVHVLGCGELNLGGGLSACPPSSDAKDRHHHSNSVTTTDESFTHGSAAHVYPQARTSDYVCALLI